jgi:hypothetical protein
MAACAKLVMLVGDVVGRVLIAFRRVVVLEGERVKK